MAWKPSTKWLFVPCRMVRFGSPKLWCLQQKMAQPSPTHCLLQNAPFFPQNGRFIGGLAPTILWRKWPGGLYSIMKGCVHRSWHAQLPACIGRSTCRSVSVLVAHIAQLQLVSICVLWSQKQVQIPDSKLRSPAGKFVAPFLGPGFRRSTPVERRHLASRSNGFLRRQDADVTWLPRCWLAQGGDMVWKAVLVYSSAVPFPGPDS